jgi:membrane protease subunit HflC
MKLAIALVLIIVVVAIVGPQALFVVDETQAAIVTRFGEPRRSISRPGLKVKTPFVDTVTYFDKRRTLFDAPPDALLTEDKKRLVIDAYAIGRIDDPLLFFKTVRNQQRAVVRATDIIASDLRQEIANDLQSEIIRTSREPIMNAVLKTVTPKLEEFGVETIDVRMKRADFPQEIAESIYARMQAERKRIADRERAEGEERGLEITARANRTAVEIRSEAEGKANAIRGAGEAEAIVILADALERDPEFYAFRRSLDAYKVFLTQNTTVVLPADSSLFQFLQSPKGITAEVDAAADGSASLSQFIDVEVVARRFLADETGADVASATLRKLERVEWSDSSLGCPEEGVSYTEAVVPGYSLVFDLDGDSLEVHTDLAGTKLASCEL